MVRVSRSTAALGVLAAVALLLASCSIPGLGGDDNAEPASTPSLNSDTTEGDGADGADSPAESTTPTPDDVEPFAVDPIVWQICSDGILECATVDVPLDHDDPTGPTIELALARRPATGPEAEVVGTIFVNPGGPGGSGVDFVLDGFAFTSDIGARYHVVGFDPRGVGASTSPACGTDRTVGPLADHSPDSEEEVAELDAEAAAVAEECVGDQPLLAHLDTDAVIRDLDLLRQGVGDERLHYYGFSYGTLIGLVYADRFPELVGHLALDGVVDPTFSLPDLLDQQAGAFEVSFQVLDAACGTTLTCPPGGAAAAHDRLVAALEANGPVGQVGQTEVELAALVALYSDGIWPTYVAALAAADQGDLSGLERLSDFFVSSIDFTSYVAVVCTDSPRPDDPIEWEAFADQMAADHPRFGAIVANEVRTCAHWPEAEGAPRGPISATGAPAALVIGNTNDPATPLVNAVSVAAELDQAGLIVVESDGHTAYRSSPCTQDLVSAYFLADEVPADVAQC
ncbi:MAG: alpha/beta hydrolase [Actinomycetota bacterium]